MVSDPRQVSFSALRPSHTVTLTVYNPASFSLGDIVLEPFPVPSCLPCSCLPLTPGCIFSPFLGPLHSLLPQ